MRKQNEKEMAQGSVDEAQDQATRQETTGQVNQDNVQEDDAQEESAEETQTQAAQQVKKPGKAVKKSAISKPAAAQGQQEDSQEEEEPDDKGQQADQNRQQEGTQDPAEEVAALRAELLSARSQLAAYAAGVTPSMVPDAVTLATAEAQAAGEVTEDAVRKAMDNVLKRHPEWKASSGTGKKSSGGFKLGADPDSAGNGGKKSNEKSGTKKPWNKFNR